MKLLIVGAGGHGRVVKEIAESITDKNGHKKYQQIDFLDDHVESAIGKVSELDTLGKDYDEVFCSIGNPNVREDVLQQAEKSGFSIARVIHPTAYVSSSAMIKQGTVVEPKAIVNENSFIGFGCIISAGAIVDHDVVVEDFCHVNVDAICGAGSRVLRDTKISAGEVIKGY